LREIEMGKTSNDSIARLNQIAYSGVRNTGLQKKIAKRADINVGRFKENEEKLKNEVKLLNFKAIEETNASISESIGNCYLSTLNVFEAMREGDCMCLALDVVRSEAAIADPTKLVIKEIIPNFLTA